MTSNNQKWFTTTQYDERKGVNGVFDALLFYDGGKSGELFNEGFFR